MSETIEKKAWDNAHPYDGECYRCGTKWRRRTNKLPYACPVCHSKVFYKKKKRRSD